MDVEDRPTKHECDFEGVVGFVTWSEVLGPNCSFKN